jgi:hypothetical protein
MFGSLGKLLAKLKASDASAGEVSQVVPTPEESTGAVGGPEGKVEAGSAEPEDLASVPAMIEILTLLARIEYGLDEKEIASSLEISPVVVLANCHALEQEMFVHHNDELAQWFIGQRGIEFLRLNGQSS